MHRYCTTNFGKIKKFSGRQFRCRTKRKTDTKGQSPIDSLPDECLEKIFSYLSVTEKTPLERVCKRWQQILGTNWKRLTNLHIVSSVATSVADTGGDVLVIHTVDPAVLRKILSRCGPFVSHLWLFDFKNLFNVYIISIVAEYCRNITTLNADLEDPFGNGLGLLMTLNQTLERVYISSVNQLSVSRCFPYIPTELLTELEIEITLPTEVIDHLNTVLQQMKSLTALTIGGCDADTLQLIGKMHTMKCLRIQQMNLDYSVAHPALLEITNLKKLEALELPRGLTLPTNFGIGLSEKCRKIKEIELSQITLEPPGWEAVCSLPRLKHVDFSNSHGLRDKALHRLPRCIENLDLTGDRGITDAGIIPFIERSSKLSWLDIRDCSGITIRTLDAVIDAVKRRTNGPGLKIYLTSHIDISKLESKSSLVEFIVED